MARTSDVPSPMQAIAAWVPPLARFGYAAKGLVYLLVGATAVRAAVTDAKEPGGLTEALALLAEGGAGRPLLLVVAVGLLAHVLWRMVQAFLDPEHPERGAKRAGMRVFYALSGVVYGSLALTAWQLAQGARRDDDGHELWVATLLAQPFGAWLVMAAGLGVMGYGLHQLRKASRGDVNRHIHAPDAGTGKGLQVLGRVGTAARGLVLLPIGWFVFAAGRRYRAAEAADTGEVLRMLDNGAMLAAIGLGLAAYGLHQMGKALFRRIRPPV